MDVRHLELVVAIDETGTLSGAAERLHVVQSGASVTLRQLERELGAVLFTRTPRRAVPTDAGAALLPLAREALACLDRARDVVAEAVDGLSGPLSVGTMTVHEPVDVPALLGAFAADHPRITLSLRSAPDGSAGLARAVAAGELDVAFASLAGSAPDGVSVSRLAVAPFRLLLPPSHPLAGRRSVALADLADLHGDRWVDSPPGFGNRAAVDAAFERRGLRRVTGIEIPDVATLPRYVAAGLGPAFVPGFVVTGDLPSPDVTDLDDLVWPIDLLSSTRPRAVARVFVAAVRSAGAGQL